jgi:hypothetical protein
VRFGGETVVMLDVAFCVVAVDSVIGDDDVVQMAVVKAAPAGTFLDFGHDGCAEASQLQDRHLHFRRRVDQSDFPNLVAIHHEDDFFSVHGGHTACVMMDPIHTSADGGEREVGGATCGAVEGCDALPLH